MPRCGAMPPKFVGRAGAEGAAWRARQTQDGRIQDLLRRPAQKARVDAVEDVDVPLELTTQDDEDDADDDVTLDPAARPQKRARTATSTGPPQAPAKPLWTSANRRGGARPRELGERGHNNSTAFRKRFV